MAFTNKHLSHGESCIKTILDENSIEYTKEYSIVNKEGGYQRIDFYVEYMNNKYAIEYMGKQHYKQSTGSWTTPLDRVQKLDKLKQEYCLENNIKLITIPYTIGSKKDIYKELNRFLPMSISYDNDKVDNYIKGIEDLGEFKNLYYNYEIKEVSNKLGLTKTQVEYYAKINNLNKQKVKIDGMNINTGRIVNFNSVSEATEYIQSTGVRSCLRRNRKTCKGWIFKYSTENFSDWSNRITDYRIKVVVLENEHTYIVLPLGLVYHELGIKKASVVEVAKGLKRSVYGYKVRYATNIETEKCFDKYSYIYYLKYKE